MRGVISGYAQLLQLPRWHQKPHEHLLFVPENILYKRSNSINMDPTTKTRPWEKKRESQIVGIPLQSQGVPISNVGSFRSICDFLLISFQKRA